MTAQPFLIGLTGPIGCGKSTVGRTLADLGGLVIDADEVARDVTDRDSSALREIRRRFGDRVFRPDGSLDRAALAAVVFADEAALTDLEEIVHPQVRFLIDARLKAAAADAVPFAVIEAIKLVEGGLAERCNEVWLVECDPPAQRARLADRGVAADDVERRLATQGTELAERLAHRLKGRMVVRRLNTNASLADTREAVENLLADALETTLH